ncbi:MAG: hypothetical protein AAGA60_04335 [Cyanobacteria bacterium P01_E01_bin.42]
MNDQQQKQTHPPTPSWEQGCFIGQRKMIMKTTSKSVVEVDETIE